MTLPSERKSNQDELHLDEYLTLIWRNVGWLILTTALSSVTAFVLSQFVLKPVYQASTTLLIDEAPVSGDSPGRCRIGCRAIRSIRRRAVSHYPAFSLVLI